MQSFLLKLQLNLYRFLALVFLALVHPALGQRDKVQPLPPPDEVSSDLSSVEAGVVRMWGTEQYPSPNPERWVTGVENVGTIEKKAMADFVENNNAGHIYIARYGMADSELISLIKKARQKNIKVTLIVDMNRALVGEVPAEGTSKRAKPRADFENLQFQPDNLMADGIRELLEFGCTYNRGDCRIVSQPVFQRADDEMIDILHDKAMLLVTNEGTDQQKVQFFHGTANFSDVTRINTLMEVADEKAKVYYLKILQSMAATLEKGGLIRDIPAVKPLRISYQDGSFMELASTFGKFNTNDRIADLFKRATNDPNFKIDGVYFNHFVMTHRATIDALVEAMGIQQDFRVRGIVDDQFVEQDSQGLAATLEGYDVFRRWGGAVSGLGYAVNSRVDFYSYMAPAKNLRTGEILVETDPDKAHMQKKLQHNKTSVVFVTENGKKWGYVFFGSFNLSSRYQNSEFQMMLKVPAESFIAQHAVWDYENILKTQPQYAIPMGKAVVRNFLAAYTNQADLTISLAEVGRAEQAILKRDYAALFALVREIYARPSTMERRISPSDLENRIRKMENYLEWYHNTLPPSDLSDYYRLKKFVSLMFVSTKTSEIEGWTLERAVRGALWRPNVDQALLDNAVAETWTRLEFPGEPYFQVRRRRDEETAKTLPALSVGMAWIFDWDDNIAFMPTKIYLFHKETNQEVSITTQQYAEIRGDLKAGVGEWGAYRIDRDPVRGSFRRFEDRTDGNYFLEDLIEMVTSPNFHKMKGPVWEQMITALSTEYTAKQFFILTARSNPPEEIYEGLQELHRRGIIRYLPPLENIYSAQNPAEPEQAKADRIAQHLDRQSKVVVSAQGPEVLDRDGVTKTRVHLMGFSEDDWGNFVRVLETVQEGVKRGKWRNVKVVLKYTGNNPLGAQMRDVVVKSDGTLRKATPGENRSFRIQLMPGACETQLMQDKPAA